MATSSERSSSKHFKGTGGPHGYGKYVSLVYIYTWFIVIFELILFVNKKFRLKYIILYRNFTFTVTLCGTAF